MEDPNWISISKSQIIEDSIQEKMGQVFSSYSEGSGSTTAGNRNINDGSFVIEMSVFPTTRRVPDLEEKMDIHIPVHESPQEKQKWINDEIIKKQKWINDEIIKKKNFQALIQIGGAQGIAKTLNTNLETGICGHRVHTSQHKTAKPHQCRRTIIFKSLGEAMNSFTVWILYLNAVLSQEIQQNEKLKNSRRLSGTNMHVKVVREGEIREVSEQDLVAGDIAVLEGGNYIPGDGLFISGKEPVIDQGSYPSFDEEENPFVEYGSRVVSGSDIRMLITASRMETGWGEPMSQAMVESLDDECRITAQIRRWNHWVEAAMLLLPILIIVGQCLHISGIAKRYDELPYFEGAPSPTQMSRSMDSTMESLILSLCISLLMIEILTKLVFTNTIDFYLGRDGSSILKMASVTTFLIDGGVLEDGSPAELSSLKRAVSTTLREKGTRIIVVSGNSAQESNYGILTSSPEDEEITVDDPEILDVNLVVTAKEFGDLNEEMKKRRAETIKAMTNCRICDKVDLIKRLQKEGHVVAFLGQRMTIAPALKIADVGISDYKKACEVVKESSDIVILVDDWPDFLVDIVNKARSFKTNVGKMIQLQLIFTASSSFINFLVAMINGKSAIMNFHIFFLNVVVSICGPLMLLTQPLNSPPPSSVYSAKIKAMWRNIIIQVTYLTLIFVIFIPVEKESSNAIYPGIFLCQIFNMVIAREPEKKNVWSGMFNINESTGGIIGLILSGICLGVSMEVEKVMWGSRRPSLKEWGIGLGIGVGCLLMDLVGKVLHQLIQNIAHCCSAISLFATNLIHVSSC